MPHFYSDDEIASFVREGADPAERVRIAAQMNCCLIEDILRICKQFNIRVSAPKSRRGRKPALTPGQMMQLKEAISRGVKQSEIAKLLGVRGGIITYYAGKIKKEKEKAPK